MAEHDIHGLRRAIAEMYTGGSTDISAGYLLGLRELTRVPATGGSTLLLISDGHANAGEQDPKFFLDVASKSATKKVTTSSIGLGVGYDESILEALARGGGGAHRFAGSIDEAIGAIAAEVNDLLDKSIVNAVLRFTPSNPTIGAPSIEILQRLPYWMDGPTYVLQLGDLFSGENRRFVIDIDVPGIAALGLCTIAEINIEYLNLADRQEISVTLPVNVNVVPGDIAAGRVADPVVRAERLVVRAQSAKSLANDELREGKVTEASNRLKGMSAALRLEANKISEDSPQTVESKARINAEADEMDLLAKTAEENEISYSSKRMTESFSRASRGKNDRNIINPNAPKDQKDPWANY
jgi:Ca-activated chloride channel family protein